jgi:predicted porin
MRENSMTRPPPFIPAVLCAATLLPGLACAQSSVTVYGIVDATVRHATNAGPDGSSLTSVGDGAYTGSRFGLKGSEDLGGGMKSLFLLEDGFDPSTGTTQQASSSANNGQGAAPGGRLFGREAWVGLSAQGFTLQLGRQSTLAHQLSSRFQPQGNPNFDALSVFSPHHVSRQDNVASLAWQRGALGLYATYTASEGNGRGRAVGASWTAGPADVVAYYQEVDNATASVTRRISAGGGSYALTSELKAFLGYMKRDDRGAGAQENDVATVALNYNLTPNLVLTASHTQDRQRGLNEGRRQTSFVGLDYVLRKRTDIYVEVDHNRLSGAYPLPTFMGTRDTQTGASLGLRHRF